MNHINQMRPFAQRLADFGPELGNFLGRVWPLRGSINLSVFETGTDQIYDMYSGSSNELRYDTFKLKTFIDSLLRLAGRYSVDPQNFPGPLKPLSRAEIAVHGHSLWGDFYHVLSSPSPARHIRSRVYVHAASATMSLEIMKVIVGQFGVNSGLWEVKTAGPGSQRQDTIVAYLYDVRSRDALVTRLKHTLAEHETWFINSLPPLVKRVGKGIGTADEPPAIEIFTGKGARHSFGSFYSTLIWVALKNTPNVGLATADGRHMLDNVLFSLRVLRVDPRNPQGFPEASALEQWYKTSVGRSGGHA